MKKWAVLGLFLISLNGFAHEVELRPFKTDYCTNFPEGTIENPQQWKHCCLMHDMFFWSGGNKPDRDVADLELRTCIEKTGEMRIATLMYLAVRAGSYSPYKYPDKKWNNGWPTRPDYQTLSPSDIDLIERELSHGYEYISSDLKDRLILELRSRQE